MAKHIMYCIKCDKYTLQTLCSCGEKTAERRPPKYSPEDKWGEYRRKVKYTLANSVYNLENSTE